MRCLICNADVTSDRHICQNCAIAWAEAERQLGRTVTLAEMRGDLYIQILVCLLCDTVSGNGIVCPICEAHLDNLPDYRGE